MDGRRVLDRMSDAGLTPDYRSFCSLLDVVMGDARNGTIMLWHIEHVLDLMIHYKQPPQHWCVYRQDIEICPHCFSLLILRPIGEMHSGSLSSCHCPRSQSGSLFSCHRPEFSFGLFYRYRWPLFPLHPIIDRNVCVCARARARDLFQHSSFDSPWPYASALII